MKLTQHGIKYTRLRYFIGGIAQPAFTYSKPMIKTPEKSVKFVQS